LPFCRPIFAGSYKYITCIIIGCNYARLLLEVLNLPLALAEFRWLSVWYKTLQLLAVYMMVFFQMPLPKYPIQG